MRWAGRRPRGPHLVQGDRQAEARQLQRGLASREAAADDVDVRGGRSRRRALRVGGPPVFLATFFVDFLAVFFLVVFLAVFLTVALRHVVSWPSVFLAAVFFVAAFLAAVFLAAFWRLLRPNAPAAPAAPRRLAAGGGRGEQGDGVGDREVLGLGAAREGRVVVAVGDVGAVAAGEDLQRRAGLGVRTEVLAARAACSCCGCARGRRRG